MGLLDVRMSCLLNVVAYVGKMKNVLILNVYWGSCIKMLGESM